MLREAAWIVVLGMLAGGVAAFVATRGLAAFLYGLTPTDPAMWALSIVALSTVTLLACMVPAWRAARADPMRALREE